MAKILTITDVGLAEIINQENLGLGPVIIDRLVVSSAKLAGDLRGTTSVPGVIKTLNDLRGGIAGDNVLNVTAQDNSIDAYTVFTVGLYSTTDVLIGIYSQNDAIITKTASTVALMAFDYLLVNISPASITVGNVEFINPPATTEMAGISELATSAEVIEGVDTLRTITPAGLSARTATTDRTGLVELATNAETATGTDSGRAVTPAGLKSVVGTLGTASQHRANTSTTDSTANSLMRNGDWGPGGFAGVVVAPGNALKSAIYCGMYGVNSSTTDNPGVSSGGVALHLAWNEINMWQMVVSRSSDDIYYRRNNGGVWSPDRFFWTSGNTSASVQALLGAADNSGIKSAIGNASETQTGVVELATAAETQAGTDAVRAITPAGLNSRTATTSRTGIVELATSQETQIGTDSARAVTPAGLRSLITDVNTMAAQTGTEVIAFFARKVNGVVTGSFSIRILNASLFTTPYLNPIFILPSGYRPSSPAEQYISCSMLSSETLISTNSSIRVDNLGEAFLINDMSGLSNGTIFHGNFSIITSLG